MANGKIEAAITLPDAGWAFELTDTATGGGGATVTIPGGGTRYMSTSGSLTDGLLTELAQQMTSVGDTYTAVLNSDGTVTITNTDANNFAIVWTDTDLRDLLGFTGNVAGATSQQSPNHVKSVWLPDGPWNKELGDNWPGHEESNKAESESIEGHVYSLSTGRKTVLNSLRWDVICKEKTWAVAEVLTNESLQTLWRDSFGDADQSWGRTKGPIRFYEDGTGTGDGTGADATYQTYSVTGFKRYKPQQRVRNQTGQWSIDFGRLVLIPS